MFRTIIARGSRQVLLALALVLPTTALATGYETTNPVVSKFYGSKSCPDLAPGTTGFRISPVAVGVSHHHDGTLSVTLDHYKSGYDWLVDWTKNQPPQCSVHAVIVGGSSKGNLYSYDPPLNGDAGLHVPSYDNTCAKVEYVEFCYTCEVVTPGGCTLGYWKNHLASWPASYAPSDALSSIFATDWNDSLLTALKFPGGPGVDGGKRILFRQAVAALLNAAHAGVGFPLSETQVIDGVNAALATGNRATMIAYADLLDQANNTGCPLN
ncbi:MAG TPA: hypothetical protein VEA16_03460 [Vicinamibacterales bacterium]|nr:hypothetical protein [Vicinamibacterales bacterium]